MLDERKAAILRAVVEEYIDTRPAGRLGPRRRRARGRGVAGHRPQRDGAARAGGLPAQPHTSAGRIPTDKGYRFFVDTLVEPAPLGQDAAQQVRSFFDRAHGELEQMLPDTSRLLSDLTDYAAVVVGPRPRGGDGPLGPARRPARRASRCSSPCCRTARSRSAPSSSTEDVDEASVTRGRRAPRRRTSSAATSTRSPRSARAAHAAADAVVIAATSAPSSPGADDDHVFVGGTARMAGAFDAVETVREVLGILEQQFVVVTLLRDVLDRGLTVAIGAETGHGAAGRVRAGGRALRGRGRAGRHHRRARARPA